jgi:hypothetical protein
MHRAAFYLSTKCIREWEEGIAVLLSHKFRKICGVMWVSLPG